MPQLQLQRSTHIPIRLWPFVVASSWSPIGKSLATHSPVTTMPFPPSRFPWSDTKDEVPVDSVAVAAQDLRLSIYRPRPYRTRSSSLHYQ